jgi:molecular chaperone IbpA
MRTAFDFSPLYRSSIGFDRVFDLLENASRVATVDNWPPYDIAKIGDDDYRITMAVAGFAENELSLTQEQNMLTVAGQKSSEETGEYLHRGIAERSFERTFQLADHVKVTNASLHSGLLKIDLKREIPEEMKPRQIHIGAGKAAPKLGTEKAKAEAEKQAA